MFCGSRRQDFEGSRDILLLMSTVHWPVVMVHLREYTKVGQWRGLGCHWVRRIGTRAPNLDNRFVAGIDNQRIGWGAAFRGEVCFVSAPSENHCISPVVIGEPGEGPRSERGPCVICSSWF